MKTAQQLLNELADHFPYKQLGLSYYDSSACLMLEDAEGNMFYVRVEAGRTAEQRRADNGEESE